MEIEAVYAAPFLNNRSKSAGDGMEKSYQEILRLLSPQDFWDFRKYSEIGYGYQVPFGKHGRPRKNAAVEMALIADKGPYSAALESGHSCPTAINREDHRDDERPDRNVRPLRTGMSALHFSRSREYSAIRISSTTSP